MKNENIQLPQSQISAPDANFSAGRRGSKLIDENTGDLTTGTKYSLNGIQNYKKSANNYQGSVEAEVFSPSAQSSQAKVTNSAISIGRAKPDKNTTSNVNLSQVKLNKSPYKKQTTQKYESINAQRDSDSSHIQSIKAENKRGSSHSHHTGHRTIVKQTHTQQVAMLQNGVIDFSNGYAKQQLQTSNRMMSFDQQPSQPVRVLSHTLGSGSGTGGVIQAQQQSAGKNGNFGIKKNMQNQGIVLPKINNQQTGNENAKSCLMHGTYHNLEGNHSKSLGASLTGGGGTNLQSQKEFKLIKKQI